MLAYVIRHAESLSNIKQADGLNAGLSALGMRQAEALARRFESMSHGVSAIYSSPFSRCIETALPVAGVLDLPIRIRPDLCEHHHLPSGTTMNTDLPTADALRRQYSATALCPDHEGPFDWVPADETFDRLLARSRSLAAFLKSRWVGEDDVVIVFGHGSPIARLIEAWLIDEPGPSFRFIIDNSAIAALRHNNEISTLVCLNEVSHLQGLPAPDGSNYCSDGSIKTSPSSGYW